MLRQETIGYLKSRRRAGLAARLGPARTPGKRQRRLGRARLFLAKDMDAGDAHVPTALGNERPRRRSRKYPLLSLAQLPEIAKRDFSAERRRHLAETGAAMPGGRFPIENAVDLRNAMRLLGHAPDREAVVAHIRRRAKAIGAPDPFAKIRKDWAQWDLEHPERHGVGEHLGRIGALGGTIYNAPRIARVIHGVLRARGYRRPSRAGLAALGAYGAVRIGGEVGAYLGRKVDETSGRLFKGGRRGAREGPRDDAPVQERPVAQRIEARSEGALARAGHRDRAEPGRSVAMRLFKFNQEHDEHGRFSGPGGSHDPTGNPVGRPRQTDYGKEPIGRSLSVAGGGIAGNVAGEAVGGVAGAAIGSVVPIVGTAAGEMAGQWLGGLAGDYVGSKLGATLYDLKQQMDGHPVGVGHVGELTPGDRAAMIGSYLGGTASWLAFGSRAGAAGARLAGRFGAHPGGFGARIGVAAGKTVADEAGAAVGSLAGRGVHAAGEEGSKVKKDYDGSFASMVPQALPQLFGPKQWAEIDGTPFAGYVRARVKETAQQLDDRGAQFGVPTRPSRNTADLFAAHYAAAGHVAGKQPAVVDPRLATVGQQAPIRKALTLPLISPNDVVSREARQSGGAANVRFLHLMQDADRKSRTAQLNRAFTGPRLENLTLQPGEDEHQYRKRVQQVIAESVRGSQLFNGGESTLYRVRLNKRDADAAFTINADIAKGLNTEDRLKQGLVYGWASVIEKDGEIVTDYQGDRITPDELVKAAHDFIRNSRQGGILHDEFGHKIGHIVESIVFTKELQDHLGIDLGKVGWLIGYQITDPKVKTLIKSGMLKAFSIGGRGRREAA